MAQAGYDPRAAHDLWDLFAAVEADAAAAKKLGKASPASLSDRFEFLRTHPSGGDRQQVSTSPSVSFVCVNRRG